MVAGVASGTRDSQKLQETTVVIRLFQCLTKYSVIGCRYVFIHTDCLNLSDGEGGGGTRRGVRVGPGSRQRGFRFLSFFFLSFFFLLSSFFFLVLFLLVLLLTRRGVRVGPGSRQRGFRFLSFFFLSFFFLLSSFFLFFFFLFFFFFFVSFSLSLSSPPPLSLSAYLIRGVLFSIVLFLPSFYSLFSSLTHSLPLLAHSTNQHCWIRPRRRAFHQSPLVVRPRASRSPPISTAG